MASAFVTHTHTHTHTNTHTHIGGTVTVVGDAFVARAYDNEAEDMVHSFFF